MVRSELTFAQPFHYSVAGISSLVGDVLSVETFAEKTRIPDAKRPGHHVAAPLIKRLFGYQSKSWDRSLFASASPVVAMAKEAMDSAHVSAADLDTLIVISCTPYFTKLDQDMFYFARELKLRDDIVPWQLSAGCAGANRAFSLLERTKAETALLVFYNIASVQMTNEDGSLHPSYRVESAHPRAERLWYSAATFSDGASAAVLRREATATGFHFYNRDAQSFGGDRPIHNPLVYFNGGGVAQPPGTTGNDALAVYEIATDTVPEYYRKAMLLNHDTILEAMPNYLETVKKLYLHQASPYMVREFYEKIPVPHSLRHEQALKYGNVASAGGFIMLHEDLALGAVENHDQICFSTVGAGPERGGAVLSVKLESFRPPSSQRGCIL